MPALGLKVKFIDPENPANIINAQFATIRGHQEMRELLSECARKEVAETIALRGYSIAAQVIDKASTPEELLSAGVCFSDADEKRRKASEELIDAVSKFVVQGFVLAGSTQENAERLASLVGPEQLGELRLKCQFGAGVVDFTKAAAL